MKRKVRIILPILLLAVSCVRQNEAQEKGLIYEVSAEVPPFLYEESTRTSIDVGSSLSVKWEMNDKIGFWPSAANVKFGHPEQAMFYVESAGAKPGSKAMFRGNGWGLVMGYKYHSYYPYDKDAAYNAVAVTYLGQRQAANENFSHLNKVDYLYSYGTVSALTTEFTYHHLGCVGIFNIKVPDNMAGLHFYDFTLKHDSQQLFVTEATFNPVDDNVTLTPTECSRELGMQLGGESGIVRDNATGQITVYMMMSPMEWKGEEITATLTASDGMEYSETFYPTTNQEKNRAYKYTLKDIKQTGASRNLSIAESANCYIVSKEGSYKFKAVKGNDFKAALHPAGVKVLWESDGTSTAPASGAIIKNVSIDGDFICFSTPSAFKRGNALIAAYADAGCTSDVLWSWHIWCTDRPADHLYPNNAGYLMDRNLGALATSGNLSAGLFYQWGRKDPFMSTATINTRTAMAANGSFGQQASDSNTGKVSWAIAHPTIYLTSGAGYELDWLCARDGSLWYNADGSKTLYDPCPPGYRVPDGSTSAGAGDGFWAKALNVALVKQLSGNLSFSNNGLNFPLAEGISFYPASGCRAEDGGFGPTGQEQEYTGHIVMLWSNYPAGADQNGAWHTQYSSTLDCNSRETPQTAKVNWNSGRAAGKNVRCMKANNIEINSSNESFGNTPIDSKW